MSPSSSLQITRILKAWSGGDETALERLTPLVLDELHRLARQYMARERHSLTLQTTALVNEAFLRLVEVQEVDWRDRAHFFGLSAVLMRRILVDFARNRQTQKRGGERGRIPLEAWTEIADVSRPDLIALDDALSALAELDERQSRVVELRFFGGLTIEETSAVLKVSEGTVRRDWRLARAWLFRELSEKKASRQISTDEPEDKGSA